ncbi:MAG: DUF1015 domain-containing protein [Coriobacteriia bacterium]
MPQVKPFPAVMYRHEAGPDITPLAAPPYDVISPALRAGFVAADPHNVVVIDLPEGDGDLDTPGNRYERAGDIWRAWREQGVLIDDASPAIYVLEQVWEHAGRHVRRRAFFASVRLHDFAECVVLPHERTLPKAITDRLNLTRACAANLSPIFGLFTDPAGETDAIFEESMVDGAMLEATDVAGVVSRVWALRNPEVVEALASVLRDKQVFIADGHHRYTTALAYRDERRAKDAERGVHPESPDYDHVLMALVNMDDPDLLVLPTHRLARAAGSFDASAFWEGLSVNFDLTEPAGGHPAAALAAETRPAFIVKTADGTVRLASLKSDVDPATAIPGDHSAAWKNLDVTVLQELILVPQFGIHPDDHSTLDRLSFVKDAHEALEVHDADAAFIMNSTRMEQLRAVALGGETMPQKSTYFYPKLLTGLLFRSMD